MTTVIIADMDGRQCTVLRSVDKNRNKAVRLVYAWRRRGARRGRCRPKPRHFVDNGRHCPSQSDCHLRNNNLTCVRSIIYIYIHCIERAEALCATQRRVRYVKFKGAWPATGCGHIFGVQQPYLASYCRGFPLAVSRAGLRTRCTSSLLVL